MKWRLIFEIQDGGRRHLELRKYAFLLQHYVQGQILNIPIKFGEDQFNSNGMATDFRNSRWWAPPSGEDRSNSYGMATDF